MYLPLEYLLLLFPAMQKLSADIVRGNVHEIMETGKIKMKRNRRGIKKIQALGGNGILVRMEVFTEYNLRFDPLFTRACDDIDFTYRVYLKNKKTFLIRCAHFYEIRPIERMPEILSYKSFNKQKSIRHDYIAVVKYNGGMNRALLLACKLISKDILEMMLTIFLIPFNSRKNIAKLSGQYAKIQGTLLGLYQIPDGLKGAIQGIKRSNR